MLNFYYVLDNINTASSEETLAQISALASSFVKDIALRLARFYEEADDSIINYGGFKYNDIASRL